MSYIGHNKKCRKHTHVKAEKKMLLYTEYATMLDCDIDHITDYFTKIDLIHRNPYLNGVSCYNPTMYEVFEDCKTDEETALRIIFEITDNPSRYLNKLRAEYLHYNHSAAQFHSFRNDDYARVRLSELVTLAILTHKAVQLYLLSASKIAHETAKHLTKLDICVLFCRMPFLTNYLDHTQTNDYQESPQTENEAIEDTLDQISQQLGIEQAPEDEDSDHENQQNNTPSGTYQG